MKEDDKNSNSFNTLIVAVTWVRHETAYWLALTNTLQGSVGFTLPQGLIFLPIFGQQRTKTKEVHHVQQTQKLQSGENSGRS